MRVRYHIMNHVCISFGKIHKWVDQHGDKFDRLINYLDICVYCYYSNLRVQFMLFNAAIECYAMYANAVSIYYDWR